MFPVVILSSIFGSAAHYFETKPMIIFLGIVALFALHFLNSAPNQNVIQSDYSNIREENENLKRNLMQVYSMVQQQKQNAPPPAPMPPGMTGIEKRVEEETDEEGKPYL